MTPAGRSADLLLKGGIVLTMDSRDTYWGDASVAILDGTIVDVGPSAELAGRYDPRRTIDARNKAVLPGFISCHGHAGMSLIRGLAEDYPLETWLTNAVWPLMRHADQEDTFAGVQLACLEMLQSGITTFTDMWRDLPATIEAVAGSGLRARLAFNMRDFDDPAALESEWTQGFDALTIKLPTDRITPGLAPHSLYACSESLLRRVAETATSAGCHLQIHLAETTSEVCKCRQQHRRGPVDMLDELGLLGLNLLVAHGVWLEAEECDRLAATGASVAHNISSNLKLASGIAPLERFKASGLNVGLGTDSTASNNTLDPFREMRLAVLAQQVAARADAGRGPGAYPGAYDALRAATISGAEALGLEAEIGSIEPGKRADIVLIDLEAPHLQPRVNLGAAALMDLLVFAATAADVSTVLVDGHVVVEDRQVRTLDPATVLREANKALKRLMDRAGPIAPVHRH